MNAQSQAIDSNPALGLPGALPDGLLERWSSLRRRRKPALVVLASILAATLLVALAWPRVYRSEATVLIEQQEIPDEFVRAAITSFADQRVRTISQRVMTTTNLLEIVRKYDLYPERRNREPRERLLARMRDDIGLEMISADVVDPRQGRPTKATIAFTVSFDSRSPLVAAKVANELTTLYLNENLESRRAQAESTAGFLQTEVDRVGTEVGDLEARIASFKSEHADALPELAQMNIQLMTRADEELRSIETRAISLDQQIVYLTAQLAQIEPMGASYGGDGKLVASPGQRLKVLRSQLASASALYGPAHPDVLRLTREVAGLERQAGATASANDLVRQYNETKRQLAEARARYSSTHPDVVRLERIVEAIGEAMRASSDTAAALQDEESPDNPAFIQVKAQREAAMNERASLRGQAADLRGRVSDYEARLARGPLVEREYSALTRDLQSAQRKYQEVRQKQMEARVASNLETEQKGERFTLIDPPLVPEKPKSPNVPLVLMLGTLLAIGASIGMALLLDQHDASVRGRADLARLVCVPPLAAVPWIETEADVAAGRQRLRRLLLVSVGVGALLIALLHFLYRPLDVLWHILLRQLGI